jgi:hypothetical protein
MLLLSISLVVCLILLDNYNNKNKPIRYRLQLIYTFDKLICSKTVWTIFDFFHFEK